MRLFTWPTTLPAPLADLYPRVVDATDSDRVPIADPLAVEALRGGSEPRDTLLIVPDVAVETTSPGEVLAALSHMASLSGIDLVVVVGDGYLGADIEPTGTAVAAAAISVMRSVAVQRGRPGRANAICIPQGMLGDTVSQRGPLAVNVDVTDVAHAAGFLIDSANSYLNGQVLYVDAGRQLFSSHTA
ncbi:MAG TPA: hypothetical protein VMS74_00390 [Acidimicrobiia bacterium]|nr:hypothetical protein [Acidimicrobiia bacterium]